MTILVVDDEEILSDIVCNILEENGYKTLSVDKAIDAIDVIKNQQSDIMLVISDVIMPVMNGYELCAAIRSDSNLANIPFMFSSSLNSLEDKIKGIESGADDYITKPVVEDDLILKVEHLLKVASEKSSLKDQLEEAQKTALQAMTYSSDLGKVVNFYEDAMLAEDFKDLSERLFKLTKAYGLSCSLRINDGTTNIFYSDSVTVAPLEQKLMLTAYDLGRFYDFGKRTLVNYDNHSLLVKNMPIDDSDQYGILKDILGAICNAMSARVAILINDINVERQKNIVLTIVKDALENINMSYRSIQQTNIEIIEDMNEKIDMAIMHLGLLEDTEKSLEQILEETITRTNKNFFDGLHIEEIFTTLKSEIDKHMISSDVTKAESFEPKSNSTSVSGELELF